MKKIKIALISLFVCALGYSGYSAYDYMTMTEAERFLLTNIEALTWDEPGGGNKPGWSGKKWTGDPNDSALNRMAGSTYCVPNPYNIGIGDRISCSNFN